MRQMDVVQMRLAPDCFEELAMADQPAGMAGKQGQNLELLSRQLHLDAVHRNPARGEVDAQRA